MSRPLLCFPLDYASAEQALAGARAVAEDVDVLKVGLELFIQAGPTIVRELAQFGHQVFLDLKLHDIPQTVESAVARAVELGVNYLTVHTGGGPTMLARALQACSGSQLTLLGVTVLTSMDQSELAQTGVNLQPSEHALALARMAASVGLTGFVASAQETAAMRLLLGTNSVLVTPGIRPTGTAAGDQRRIATPAEAVRAGSSMLVVGRPIRDAESPSAAARAIHNEIAGAYAREQESL